MWLFKSSKNSKPKGTNVAEKKDGESSSGNVPVFNSSGKDPMNDTQVICQSVADKLDELNRVKAQVKQKQETVRLKAERLQARVSKK